MTKQFYLGKPNRNNFGSTFTLDRPKAYPEKKVGTLDFIIINLFNS
jgi:hypothetical protein